MLFYLDHSFDLLEQLTPVGPGFTINRITLFDIGRTLEVYLVYL